MVTKIFDPDVSIESIADEVGRLRSVSGISFAPAINKWDINSRWYEEEYVPEFPLSSYKTMGPAELLSSFASDIVPCLRELMVFKKPSLINAADYADNIHKKLDQFMAGDGLYRTGEADKISDFIISIRKRVAGNPHLYLVFSHGDFCPANILKTRNGIRVLDWEGAGKRSALFDFYSYFFYLPVCINYSLTSTVSAVNNTLHEYLSHLTPGYPDIYKNISTNDRLYRNLFYLEFISKLLERETTDKNLDIMDFIFRYIDAFNGYEEILSENL